MSIIFKKTGAALLFILLVFNVNALELNVEFSAEAIQVSPGRPLLSSKMYVSKHAVRTDMVKNKFHIIEIVYPAKGKRVLLYPEQKKYIEQTGLPVISSWSGKSEKTPCEGVKNASCKKIAKETLNNVKVEKWQVEQRISGKLYRSLHWIDSKRRIAVKELFYDGGVAELKMLGKDKLYKRNVEKWQYQYFNPAGQRRVSRQWYDPQLKMVIKEEMPGGYLRELRNIIVRPQNKSLFVIPADYDKLDKSDSLTNKHIKPMIKR